jgi:peptidyl-tRNA hydrolase
MTSRIASIVAVALLMVAGSAEPEELETARKEFEKTARPTEAARVDYLTRLIKLREKLMRDGDWKAVDQEIMRHPVPANTDARELSVLIEGPWASPRHDYMYQRDSTWSDIDPDSELKGKWRVEGNQFFVTQDPQESRYTILLLTPANFVYTDGEYVFYLIRIRK